MGRIKLANRVRVGPASASGRGGVNIRAVVGSGNPTSNPAAAAGTGAIALQLTDGFDPPWPRLGAVPINDQRYDLLSQRQHWSKFHIVCFTHYNGWQSGRSMTMAEVMQDMKARAPAGLGVEPIHVIYTIKDETYTVPDSATQRLHDKLNAENWWLRTSFPSGSIVPHEFPGNSVINDSSYCPPDSSGRNWNAWKADLDVVQNKTGEAGNAANPYVDGLSCDVVIWKPRWDGDYNRDGVSDSQNNSTIQYALREGQKQYFDRILAQWPQAYVFANTDFGLHQGGNLYSSSYTPNPSAMAPMNGVLHGSQMEYMLSDASSPFAIEYQVRDPQYGLMGFWALRNAYREWEAVVQYPKVNIFFDHQAFRGTDATSWRATRFGMAACWVLGNAYVYQHPDSFSSSLANWADEYDFGGLGQGWLGKPVSGAAGLPQTGPSQNGVYIREFENGYVAVNPRNNGAQTITFPIAVQRCPSTSTSRSDPAVNTGAIVAASTPISLSDRDGLVVRKVADQYILNTKFSGLSWVTVADYGDSKDYRLEGTDSLTGQIFSATSPQYRNSTWGDASLTLQLVTGSGQYPTVTPDALFTRQFETFQGLTCLSITRNTIIGQPAYVLPTQAAMRLKTAGPFSAQGIIGARGKVFIPAGVTPGSGFMLTETKFNYGDKKIELVLWYESGQMYFRFGTVRLNTGGFPWGTAGGPYVNSTPTQTTSFGNSNEFAFYRAISSPVGKWVTYEFAMRPADNTGTVAGGAAAGWAWAALGVGTSTTPVAYGSCTQEFYVPGVNMADTAAPGATIIFPMNHYTDWAVNDVPLRWTDIQVLDRWISDSSSHPVGAL